MTKEQEREWRETKFSQQELVTIVSKMSTDQTAGGLRPAAAIHDLKEEFLKEIFSTVVRVKDADNEILVEALATATGLLMGLTLQLNPAAKNRIKAVIDATDFTLDLIQLMHRINPETFKKDLGL